jgi:hypothetical protein
MQHLSLRPYNDKRPDDLAVIDGDSGRDVGFIRRDGQQWQWSVTSYAHNQSGVITGGTATSKIEAKEAFMTVWSRWFACGPTIWAVEAA